MVKAIAVMALKGTDQLLNDMGPQVKMLFLCKLAVMLASCGYIYENLLTP